MSKGKQPDKRSHGRGIYSKYQPKLYEGKGGWVYYVQYYWNGQRLTEQAPADEDGRWRLKTAQRLKSDREQRKHATGWLPPKVQQQLDAEAAAKRDADDLAASKTRDTERRELLYEVAVERFLADAGAEYSDPAEVGRVFRNRLSRAFSGRYLDELTKRDVRQYYLDREQATGPFDGLKPVSVRTPQYEVTYLSALYTWLDEDEGREGIANPCHRPRTRRRKRARFQSYEPKHKKPEVPPEALRFLLTNEARGKDKSRLVRDKHRALWALVYYTAARPESEPCLLRHGDVTLPDSDTGWGELVYRDTKTGGDRRVLLHPEAARLLRAVMQPVPILPEARERWRALYVFGRRASDAPWDRNTYRKAWHAQRREAAESWPELARAWVRDLRTVAKTRMIDSGAPELAVNRILGHSDGVAGRYYTLNSDPSLPQSTVVDQSSWTEDGRMGEIPGREVTATGM